MKPNKSDFGTKHLPHTRIYELLLNFPKLFDEQLLTRAEIQALVHNVLPKTLYQ